MKINYFLGIDVSKNWFNYCLLSDEIKLLEEGKIDNTEQAILVFISKILKNHSIPITSLMVVMEHTGIYTKNLNRSFALKDINQALIHAGKISSSLGIDVKGEGKSDSIDARRIAEYGVRFVDKLTLWAPKSQEVELLQRLQRQRKRLLEMQSKLKNPIAESEYFDTDYVFEKVKGLQKDVEKEVDKAIKEIELHIGELIESSKQLQKQFIILTSVVGIGPVVATEIIITTEGFTKFTPEQVKKYANSCGVIPKQFKSGLTNKKDRITKKGNKQMKTLLTLACRSLINTDTELGRYYHRKRAEGKKYLSVINAMRNKLIHRAFAVIRNEVMYQRNMNIN